MTHADRIPTNLRLLLILEIMGRSDRAMTPTEVNKELGLPKQSIHRLFDTLVEANFIKRDTDRNRFRPATRARLMANGLLHISRETISRHQIMQALANDVKETVNFVVPEETGMYYLDRVETDWPFRIQLPRGTNVPFHCTASGKCFMASLNTTARKKFVNALTLERHTKNTVTAKSALLKELEIVCAKGYALDLEEFMDGMTAISVPVFDAHKRYIASIATHGPIERLSLNNEAELAKLLQKYAKILGKLL